MMKKGILKNVFPDSNMDEVMDEWWAYYDSKSKEQKQW
jgi:hypothetical protein